LKKHVSKNPEVKFFIALDNLEMLPTIKEALGDTFYTLPRTCTGRKKECMYYALADLLLLSKTYHLLDASRTEFSDAAIR
jgi:hypothetical protein